MDLYYFIEVTYYNLNYGCKYHPPRFVKNVNVILIFGGDLG